MKLFIRWRERKRIGDLLRERGSIDQTNLDRALDVQTALGPVYTRKVRLGEVLVHNFKLKKKDVAAALEEAQGIEYVDCRNVSVSKEALRLIPRDLALRASALPLAKKDHSLVVVMAEPSNLAIIEDLRFRAGMNIVPQFGFREEISEAILKSYGREADDFTIDRGL